ncbi:MAG: peptidoglycan/LPS O-acetylase OafA/YrhL [Kiritimatiellia bacterium]|jgi:peptidoglycan/LPS O-acetylase OafA/YrhL
MLKSQNYRPEIDGLRAIAVLPVMLFHAGIGPFSGGYIGVDIFFVISGFLITNIIYRDVSEGKFTFSGFYERRARRILPTLYFVLFVSILAAWFVLIPVDFIDFSRNLIGSVTFSSNITLWLQQDYFDQAAELKPLLHTWSLAIEEQYYLFFPILLIVLYRYAKNRIFLVIFSIMLLSLCLSHWGAYNKPSSTYYLLPTRAWELLVGSIIALLHYQDNWSHVQHKINKYANLLSIMGLVLVVLPMVTYDEHTPFPSMWTLPPIMGAVLLILYSQPKTIVYKFLSHRFFVGIGLISYSAYLWHQPMYAFMRQQALFDASSELMLIAFFFTLLIAYFSWKYIEQPFRDRSKISNTNIWMLSSMGMVIFVLLGLLVIKNNGFENRFALRSPLTEATFDIPKRSNGWCFYSVDTNTSLRLGENGFHCPLGTSEKEPKVLLFGDSYAGMYEPFWDTVGKKLSLGINSITTNWCYPSFTENFWWHIPTPALDQCMMNRKFVSASLSDYEVVVISALWVTLEEKELMGEVLDFVSKLTNEYNLKVIIMAQPPALTRTSVMDSVYKNGDLVYAKGDASAQRVNTTFSRMAESNSKLLFIDRESLFATASNDGQQLLSKDGIPYSLDGGHISIYGSLQAGDNYIQGAAFDKLKRFVKSKP